jgi:hypothetical protein
MLNYLDTPVAQLRECLDRLMARHDGHCPGCIEQPMVAGGKTIYLCEYNCPVLQMSGIIAGMEIEVAREIVNNLQ